MFIYPLPSLKSFKDSQPRYIYLHIIEVSNIKYSIVYCEWGKERRTKAGEVR